MDYKEIFEYLKQSESFPNDAYKPEIFENFELKGTLTEESDRGCALMAVSYIEIELGEFISSYFVRDDKLNKRLFSGFGPLSSFSSKIDIAYSIGLIPKLMHRDLHILRKIRNEFAHDPGKFGFEKSAIGDKCRELYYDAIKNLDQSPRRIFERCAVAIALYIRAAKSEIEQIDRKEDINMESLFKKMIDMVSEIADKKIT